VARTENCRIILEDGRELIDGIASWWTACHGYNHPHIRDAIARQLAIMPHVMLPGSRMSQRPNSRRGWRACCRAISITCSFRNPGSVAVEIALKMAVQYWRNRGRDRTKFLAFKGGYHGDTLGAMAVSDPEEGMHRGLRTICRNTIIANLPRDAASTARLEQIFDRHAQELAGIIVEPLVQGAGGMIFHDAGVLQRLRDLVQRFDLLFIADEIFTGFGRTGKMFACEAAAIVRISLHYRKR